MLNPDTATAALRAHRAALQSLVDHFTACTACVNNAWCDEAERLDGIVKANPPPSIDGVIDAWRGEVRRLGGDPRLMLCVWCGAQITITWPNVYAASRAHDEVCPKNPLRQRAERVEAALAKVAEASCACRDGDDCNCLQRVKDAALAALVESIAQAWRASLGGSDVRVSDRLRASIMRVLAGDHSNTTGEFIAFVEKMRHAFVEKMRHA